MPDQAALTTGARVLDIGVADGAGRRVEVDAAPLAVQTISIIPDEALADGDFAERVSVANCVGIFGWNSRDRGNDGEGCREQVERVHFGSLKVVLLS